jgi:hypothetical protein
MLQSELCSTPKDVNSFAMSVAVPLQLLQHYLMLGLCAQHAVESIDKGRPLSVLLVKSLLRQGASHE